MKFSENWLREWVNPPCSTRELCHIVTMGGLEVEHCEKIFDKTGSDINQDTIIELSITPNRADCLSIKGIAREVAALTQTPLRIPFSMPVLPEFDTAPIKRTLTIEAPDACPCYRGLVIHNINMKQETPAWIQARLLACGLKVINGIVDILNYVMLELGQPMHAFDLAKIGSDMTVRKARSESFTTLDNQIIKLDQELVVSDSQGILALAGIMGGLSTAISNETQSIFIESAFFQAASIAGVSRKYNLLTQSAFRFERGVDSALGLEALTRAAQLILEISGGTLGGMIEKKVDCPIIPPITLNYDQINQKLGQVIEKTTVDRILTDLGCQLERSHDAIIVSPPSFRIDIRIIEDLIEEVARVYGYDHIQTRMPIVSLSPPPKKIKLSRLKRFMIDQGYHEVINYSFVAPALQSVCEPFIKALDIANPLSSEMSQMRTSLWPGLIQAVKHNQAHGLVDLRLFETGLRFRINDSLVQEAVISGIAVGRVMPIHWQSTEKMIDFYDIKGDIESLIGLSLGAASFEACEHPVLAAGQSARIRYQSEVLGIIGVLDPACVQKMDLQTDQPIIVFELLLAPLLAPNRFTFKRPSKYPSIRRDLSLIFDKDQPMEPVLAFIRRTLDERLKLLFIFDVYVKDGKKSIGIAFVFQDENRTLLDTEIEALMQKIIQALLIEYQAELRI